MSEQLSQPDAEAALARAETAIDGLVGLSLDGCADADILPMWRRLEVVTRRLAAVDQAVISQVQARHLAFVNGAKTITVLARSVLHISAGEAQQRVIAAGSMGPRVTVSGEPLEPVFEHVAAAQAAGAISARHARIITSTITRLPDAVQAEQGGQIEADLVGYAETFDPDAVATIARRLTALLDPDGLLEEVEYRHRHRELTLQRRTDGSGHLAGELTAECAEHLAAILDSLAKPRPTGPDPAERDPRTATQRRHDALLEALKIAQRAELVPNAGGVTCTVLLTGTVTDWQHAADTVTTGHGAIIPTVEAQRWVGGDTRFLGILLNSMKRVEAYSTSHRLFAEHQRLAMAARDGGCCFPGCDAPPGQTEAHHMINHCDGGPTSIDNGALLCASNHRDHQRMGWHGIMLDGRPAWIPPKWLDADQTPRRNRLHHPEPDRQPV